MDVFSSIRLSAEAASFLAVCGPFRERSAVRQRVSWDEFQAWQRFIRSGREGGPPMLPGGAPIADGELLDAILDPAPTFDPAGGARARRAMTFRVETALEYFGAAVLVDDLRKADFIECRLRTCRKLFERRSDHESKFCCPPHARQHAKRVECGTEEKELTNAKA